MNVCEAKDFVQNAEQAALDSVPLSDLEKRMMHFTESDDKLPSMSNLKVKAGSRDMSRRLRDS